MNTFKQKGRAMKSAPELAGKPTPRIISEFEAESHRIQANLLSCLHLIAEIKSLIFELKNSKG
jgi:hypothetical protein